MSDEMERAASAQSTNPRRICRRWEGCEANCCPLDPGLALRTWYADEAICKSSTHGGGVPWILAQRKIARAIGHLGTDGGYFYTSMLERGCVIGRGMRGIDPDKPDEAGQLARWMREHPPVQPRPMTPEQKQAAVGRLAAARVARKGASVHET